MLLLKAISRYATQVYLAKPFKLTKADVNIFTLTLTNPFLVSRIFSTLQTKASLLASTKTLQHPQNFQQGVLWCETVMDFWSGQ